MTNGKPFVSIGLAVYNGERYIRQALDSLLAQDYDNFELIISDNASTDGTREICLEYAARDKRIWYYRNQTNMGAAWNFDQVFELSSGEYFMWAAHDDYWDPRYIRLCLEAFDTSGAIVLAGTQGEIIDPETEEVILTYHGFSTVGLGPVERFRLTTAARSRTLIVYGVYKRSALREVMPFRRVPLADKVMLAKLCFQGEFVTVQQTLIFKRQGGASSTGSHLIAENISNPLFRWFRLLGRQVMMQKIIFQTDRLTLRERIGLASWLAGEHVLVFGPNLPNIMAGTIYRMLLVLRPTAAMRARELWRKRRRKNIKVS